MQDRFAPTLGFVTLAVALASASALIGGKAYAETPTIDTTPFVSTLTRDEVRAELMASRGHLMNAEWELQANDMHAVPSGYTRAEAVAAYIASRTESSAFNSEDSGSSYLAQHTTTGRRDSMVASSR